MRLPSTCAPSNSGCTLDRLGTWKICLARTTWGKLGKPGAKVLLPAPGLGNFWVPNIAGLGPRLWKKRERCHAKVRNIRKKTLPRDSKKQSNCRASLATFRAQKLPSLGVTFPIFLSQPSATDNFENMRQDGLPTSDLTLIFVENELGGYAFKCGSPSNLSPCCAHFTTSF